MSLVSTDVPLHPAEPTLNYKRDKALSASEKLEAIPGVLIAEGAHRGFLAMT